MRTGTVVHVAATLLLAAPPANIWLVAQENTKAATPSQHHRYQLIDLGTLGGPSAYKSMNAPGLNIEYNSRQQLTKGRRHEIA